MTTMRRPRSRTGAVLAATLTGTLLAATPATSQLAQSPQLQGPTARAGSVEDPDVVEPAARDVRSASFRFAGGAGTAVVQLGAQPDAETAATLRVVHGRWQQDTCVPESEVTAVDTLEAAQDGRVWVPLTYELSLWSLDCAGVTLVSTDGETEVLHDAVDARLQAEHDDLRQGSVSIVLRDQELVEGRDRVRVLLTNDRGIAARLLRIRVTGPRISTPRAVRVRYLGSRRTRVVMVPVRVLAGRDTRPATARVSGFVPGRFVATHAHLVRVQPRR